MVGTWTRRTFSRVAIAGALAGMSLTAAATAQDDTTSDEASRPRCENVLPATTRAFISAPDTADLIARWDRTRVGELIGGPLMESFVEEVYDRLQEVWLEGHQRLGIEWADIRDVPSGQVALGYVHEPNQRPAIVFWMDVQGNIDATEAMLAKFRQNLIDEGAQRDEAVFEGVTMSIYTVPPREGLRRNDKVVHFIKDDIFVVAGGRSLAEKLIERWDGSAADSLGAQESFRAVMKRCQQGAGEMTPELRWFIDPFPLIDALKETAPPKEETEEDSTADEVDMMLVLRNQGFDAVGGVGGYVHLDEGSMDVLHRTAIHVPGARRESMELITLPNAPLGELPAWVNDDIVSIKLLNIDAKAGFEMIGKFFEEVLRPQLGDTEGLWDEIIDGFLNDPYVLKKVDIRKDIVGSLGSRAILISDYTTPITADSERTLIAVETTDAATIAKAIADLYDGDDTFVPHKIGGAVVWEAVGEPKDDDAVEDEYEDGELLPLIHFAVAHDYLFVSTSFDIIKETLEKASDGPRLADAADYRQVGELLDELGASETCYRSFNRTDEANRVTYELTRQNRLSEATSMFGRLVNALLENRSSGEAEAKAIDGGKLPAYEEVGEYLGPGGMFVVTEDDGWYATGFVLGKGKTAASDDDAADDDADDTADDTSDADEESPGEEDN